MMRIAFSDAEMEYVKARPFSEAMRQAHLAAD